MRCQRGQTAAEYVGMLFVVGVLVAAVARADAGTAIRDAVSAQICKLAQQAGCGAASAPKAGRRRLTAHAHAAALPPHDPPEPKRPVPLMPQAPPLDGPRDGAASGVWHSRKAGLKDRLKKQLAWRVADAAELKGLTNAARNLRHYLHNTGDSLSVDPRALLRDIPRFRVQAAQARLALIKRLQQRARRAYDGKTSYLYESGYPWAGGVPSDPSILGDDWFFAMGGFSYTYSARATVRPPSGGHGEPTVQVEYRLHVFDRYNWDGGKSVHILGQEITDDELGTLNKAGLAHVYDIKGTTGVDSVTVGLNEHVTTPPPAEPAPGRGGTRDDPGRDRGRGRGGR